MEVRVILELEPQTSPRSQGHHLCKALLGHIMGMEDPSNPMEQGGVQLSKPVKVKKILFYLSLFLQTSIKIAQRVMLSCTRMALVLCWSILVGRGRKMDPALMLHPLLFLGGTTPPHVSLTPATAFGRDQVC